MKNIIKIALLILAIFLSFMIYRSVDGLVTFNKLRVQRYADAAGQLQDVANAERLYKVYNGAYTDNLDSLKHYLKEGKIYIINRKDSSGYVYDSRKRIDVMKSFTIVDTIASATSVKDSILGNRSIEDFGFVEIEGKKIPIDLYASFTDRIIGEDSTNIQRDHLFKASVSKKAVLAGLGDDYIEREMNDETSAVKADEIKVGSDRRPTLEGNWSSEVDQIVKERRARHSAKANTK